MESMGEGQATLLNCAEESPEKMRGGRSWQLACGESRTRRCSRGLQYGHSTPQLSDRSIWVCLVCSEGRPGWMRGRSCQLSRVELGTERCGHIDLTASVSPIQAQCKVGAQ